MTIRQSLKATGIAIILALALAACSTWTGHKKGHGGTDLQAMRTRYERIDLLVRQLSEHAQMMKGIQDYERLGQEMTRHQEMINQVMAEMDEHQKAMEEMMGGQHEESGGEGHSHQGSKGDTTHHGSGIGQWIWDILGALGSGTGHTH